MRDVEISKGPKTITVRSPYNSEFVTYAKSLAGKFGSGVWTFDARDEDRVRKLCLDIYGVDGINPPDTCSVRVEWMDRDYENQAPIEFMGFTVARAFGRDSGAKLGDGIVHLEGHFDSGGSVKNWTTTASKGTVIIMRDMPRAKIQEYIDNPPSKLVRLTVEIEPKPETSPGRPERITSEMFDEKLAEIIDRNPASALMAVAGVYELLAEEFNNAVLDELGIDGEPDAAPE